MAFQIGNISINKAQHESDREEGICSACHHECHASVHDDSFYDHFGYVENTYWASNCCGADILEGQIYIDRMSQQTARKDYKKIKKGEVYWSRFIKGWCIDEHGVRRGIVQVNRAHEKKYLY